MPGLDGTSVLFEPLLNELSIAAVPVAYPQSLPSTYVALLPRVIENLPADGAFVLLGWSFSGPLALMAAATRPRGLRGIVLCASFVQKPVFYLPKMVRHLVKPFLFRNFARASQAKARLGGYSTKEIEEQLDRANSQVPREVMAARVRETLTVDVREELHACNVPVMYLGATRDQVVPSRNAKRIQSLRPDVQLRLLAGPHLALATNPRAAARAIEDFWASVRE